jgi:hypothetical protein
MAGFQPSINGRFWVSTEGQFDRSAQRGMPAHITVLYPFLPPDSLSPERMSELRTLFLGQRRFRFSLGGVCGFPDVVYLAPEPLAPFDALTSGAAARFPETPPYGGVIAKPIPHLTIAQRPPAPDLVGVTDRFVLAAGARLPLECAADEVALAIKRAGRWSIGPRFALA